MELFEAIFQRRSADKVRPDPVPRELIEKILAAAVQAPNHFKVRPWRFFVLTGAARERLGDCMAEAVKKRNPNLSPEALAAVMDVERARPLRAPVVIAVGVDRPSETRVIEVENICAAAAAVQNMLLAAHALGLGAKWRTGNPAYDPDVKDFFGLAPDQHLIGFIYLGFPVVDPSAAPPPARPSFEDRTHWM